MKKHVLVFLAFTVALTGAVQAQLGRLGSSGFTSTTIKLFEANPVYSADIEIQTDATTKQSTTMPGKISFDSGKSRLQINLGDGKSTQGGPQFGQQMKTLGMDTTVIISRPDKKVTYVVYPNLSAYAETPLKDPNTGKPNAAFKTQTTELGKETLDGHACVKNKIIVTDDQGKSLESIVWNATDLKKFPVKIELHEAGNVTVMLFKNVKFAKPDAALFEPPTNYKKYASQHALVTETMKRKSGDKAVPPAHP